MLSYTIKVRTKLGSLRSKEIIAESEEEALDAAKKDFPLFEDVWIEGAPAEVAEDEARAQENAAQDRISEMKRNAAIEKAKAKRSEGLIWLGVGIFLTLTTFLFVRNAFIIALGPVIWGGYIFKTADSRMKTLREEQEAGVPYLDR